MDFCFSGFSPEIFKKLELPDVKRALLEVRGGGAAAEHRAHTVLVCAGITDRKTRDRILRMVKRSTKWKER